MANWGYAFLYGSFFDNQLKFSVGKMGDSPWALDDADFEKELDTTIGMRFEYMPFFVPGLNIGFVLNDWNTTVSGDLSFKDLLMESVLGLSYTHDYFHLRFAYRLDSEADKDGPIGYDLDQGGRLLYHVEEHIIGNYLPNFNIWASGYFEELGNKDKNMVSAKNKLYAQYAPDNFTAQLCLGYDIVNTRALNYDIDKNRQYFSVRPSFFYKLFDNFLNIGVTGEFAKDFGKDKIVSKSYLHWYVEPQVRVNLGINAYLSFVYRYQDDFYKLNINTSYDMIDVTDPSTWIKHTTYECVNAKTHWINLRAVFTF